MEEAMEQPNSMVLSLLILSGVVAVVLAILAIYRGTLSAKEDDQIFIDAAEQHHYQEQQMIIAKISKLNRPIIALSIILGLLLLTSAGIWIYEGLKNF
jgi:hypothetical protein